MPFVLLNAHQRTGWTVRARTILVNPVRDRLPQRHAYSLEVLPTTHTWGASADLYSIHRGTGASACELRLATQARCVRDCTSWPLRTTEIDMATATTSEALS